MPYTAQQIEVLLKAKDEMSPTFTKVQDTLARARLTFENIGTKLVELGKKAIGMSISVGTSMAGSAFSFKSFEGAMNKVAAVSGATGEQLGRLSSLAKELGTSTAFSAKEAAEGMSFLAMAGFEVEDTLTAMPGVLQLAAAGQLELARAADITSNVLSGYGFEATEIGRVNDVMTATFSAANTSLEQMGDAMSYVAPVAAGVGFRFEETAAAIGKLGDAGIQSTRAGTALRGMISSLLDPNEKAQEHFERLGISVHNADGSLKGLNEVLAALGPLQNDNAAITQIFGREVQAAAGYLIRNAGAVAGLSTELEKSEGITKKTAATMQKGLTGAWTRMLSALDGLSIAMGEVFAPTIALLMDLFTALVQKAADVVNWFNKLHPAIKHTATGIGIFLTVLAPALIGLGLFLRFIGRVIQPLILMKKSVAEVSAVTGAAGNAAKTASGKISAMAGATTLAGGAATGTATKTGILAAAQARLAFATHGVTAAFKAKMFAMSNVGLRYARLAAVIPGVGAAFRVLKLAAMAMLGPFGLLIPAFEMLSLKTVPAIRKLQRWSGILKFTAPIVSALGKVLGLLGSVIGTVGRLVIRFLIGPWGAAALALGTLVYQTDRGKRMFKALWYTIKELGEAFWWILKGAWRVTVEFLNDKLGWAIEWVTTKWREFMGWLTDTTAFKILAKGVDLVAKGVTAFTDKVLSAGDALSRFNAQKAKEEFDRLKEKGDAFILTVDGPGGMGTVINNLGDNLSGINPGLTGMAAGVRTSTEDLEDAKQAAEDYAAMVNKLSLEIRGLPTKDARLEFQALREAWDDLDEDQRIESMDSYALKLRDAAAAGNVLTAAEEAIVEQAAETAAAMQKVADATDRIAKSRAALTRATVGVRAGIGDISLPTSVIGSEIPTSDVLGDLTDLGTGAERAMRVVLTRAGKLAGKLAGEEAGESTAGGFIAKFQDLAGSIGGATKRVFDVVSNVMTAASKGDWVGAALAVAAGFWDKLTGFWKSGQQEINDISDALIESFDKIDSGVLTAAEAWDRAVNWEGNEKGYDQLRKSQEMWVAAGRSIEDATHWHGEYNKAVKEGNLVKMGELLEEREAIAHAARVAAEQMKLLKQPTKEAREEFALLNEAWGTMSPDEQADAWDAYAAALLDAARAGHDLTEAQKELAAGAATIGMLKDVFGDLAGDEHPLQGWLDDMTMLGQLTDGQAEKYKAMYDEAFVDTKAMEDAAEAWGIKLEQLGPRYDAAKLSEKLLETAGQFQTLIASGLEVGDVIEKMSKKQVESIQDMVSKAIKMGQAIPTSMRPLIESMVKAGMLTDSLGNKLEDTSQIDFGSGLTTQQQIMLEGFAALIEAVGGTLPDAFSKMLGRGQHAASGVADAWYSATDDVQNDTKEAFDSIGVDLDALLSDGQVTFAELSAAWEGMTEEQRALFVDLLGDLGVDLTNWEHEAEASMLSHQSSWEGMTAAERDKFRGMVADVGQDLDAFVTDSGLDFEAIAGSWETMTEDQKEALAEALGVAREHMDAFIQWVADNPSEHVTEHVDGTAGWTPPDDTSSTHTTNFQQRVNPIVADAGAYIQGLLDKIRGRRGSDGVKIEVDADEVNEAREAVDKVTSAADLLGITLTDVHAGFQTAQIQEYVIALQDLAEVGIDAATAVEAMSDAQVESIGRVLAAAVDAGQTIPAALQPILDRYRELEEAREAVEIMDTLIEHNEHLRDTELAGIDKIIEGIKRKAKADLEAIDEQIDATVKARDTALEAIDDQIKATEKEAAAAARGFRDRLDAAKEEAAIRIDAIDKEIERAHELHAVRMETLNAQIEAAEADVHKTGETETVAEKYGIDLAGATKYQTQAASDRILKLAEDVAQLQDAGVNVQAGLSDDFDDEVVGAVNAAHQFGLTIPEELRSLVGSFGSIDAGILQFGTGLTEEAATLKRLQDERAAVEENFAQQIEVLTDSRSAVEDELKATVTSIETERKASEDKFRDTLERLRDHREVKEKAFEAAIDALKESRKAAEKRWQHALDHAYSVREEREEFWSQKIKDLTTLRELAEEGNVDAIQLALSQRSAAEAAIQHKLYRVAGDLDKIRERLRGDALTRYDSGGGGLTRHDSAASGGGGGLTRHDSDDGGLTYIDSFARGSGFLNFGGGTPAVLHGQERVQTPGQAAAEITRVIERVGGTSQPIHVTVQMPDGQVLAEVVAEAQGREDRRIGRPVGVR